MFGAKFFEKFTTNGDLGLAGSRMVTSADEAGGGRSVAEKAKALPAPTETLKEVFLDIKDSLRSVVQNTSKTVELLSSLTTIEAQEQIKDQAEDRRESIGRGETDKEKGPGILSKVGGALQKVNPFSEEFGFGNIGRLLLFGAGLLALNLFGNKLVEPLANLLETIKTGKVGTTISDTIERIKKELGPFWEDIKFQVGLFIDNVKMVYQSIVGTVKVLRDYVMQFDVRGATGPAGMPIGDGRLDEYELSLMFKDLKSKIVEPLVEAVYDIANQAAIAIISGLGLITVSNILSKLSPVVVGGGKNRKGKKTSARGKGNRFLRFFKTAGLTRFGIAALGGIVLAGLFAFASDAAFAIESALDDQIPDKDEIDKALDKEQKDKGPGFVNKLLSAFMVGPDSGSTFVNVLSNAFNKGLIGAAIGSAGFIPFTALAGFIGGAIFGGLSAYFGEEKVSKAIDLMFGDQSLFGRTIDYLYDTYEMLILKPFEFIFGKLGVKNDSLFTRLGFFGIEPDAKRLQGSDIYGDLATDQSVADSMSSKEKISSIQTKQAELDRIDKVYGDDLTGSQKHDVKRLKLQIDRMKKSLEKEFGMDYERLEFFNFNVDPNTVEIKRGMFPNATPAILDDYVAKKLSDMGVKLAPVTSGGLFGAQNQAGMMIVGNKSNADNNSVTIPQLSGLTGFNQDPGTMALVNTRLV